MHIADPRQVPSGIFLYTLRPARLAMLTEGPTPEEQALAGRHWMYSQELLSRGVLVFAGRTPTRDTSTFAVVVIRAPSLDAAREIAEADPAVAGGVFRAELFPFQPMLMGAWPPEAATVTPAAHLA
ncbi:MAG TPA: YciI family protein [Gemmatimonadaceae bacterium]|nr:YciI family protein [Gemmatimonadaceae bacterium]